jgi:hypothetical protein
MTVIGKCVNGEPHTWRVVQKAKLWTGNSTREPTKELLNGLPATVTMKCDVCGGLTQVMEYEVPEE